MFNSLRLPDGDALVRRALLLVVLFAAPGAAPAQSAPTEAELARTPPTVWVKSASDAEVAIINDDGSFPLRYTVRKVDGKGDMTREVIESRDGAVARLVLRNGQPLTPAADAAERKRLEDILDDPAGFARHHKRDVQARNYAIDLVREMPHAMLFTYAPGQPQWPDPQAPQVVIDFKPDPAYHPPNMVSEALTGIAGRLWIDARTRRLVRIEGRVLKPVDFGWGMLARVYPGGTVEFQQAQVGPDRWVYSHLRENLTIREMLVKTAQQQATMDAARFALLPSPLSLTEAVHALLATPLPQ